MATRTKAELETDNAALNEVVDAISDVLDDDELSASRKVVAALEELDKLEEDEDQGEED